ncbi:hypothetical protein H8K35_07385 [Undibacterium sp. LX40W]|uniref:YCII-related domain-containing protein n=1 Tax=Undibacterium nitidum TaxID=2762298 RepID=A0A923HH86_9BURK|nr:MULTISPECIES: YciI family protein [Undibacterium]MBC3879790.1 hypothetical protein [Undibacterium nitidum]MBC3891474.1 hypothetical protein [Undibacterium sp. LX40W]
MLFAVRFRDKQDTSKCREENLSSHISWLDKHRDTILIAGSLRHAPEHAPVGGLWIVEAKSREEVVALIETDPFWLVGLRDSVEILHWSKAFTDRHTLV